MPIGLGKFSTRYVVEYGKRIAAATVAAVAALMVFFFAARYIMQGITLLGVKG